MVKQLDRRTPRDSPESLMALDVVGLLWLTESDQHCMKVRDSDSGLPEVLLSNSGGPHFSASLGSLCQGAGEESPGLFVEPQI